jgi:hypothetical protein
MMPKYMPSPVHLLLRRASRLLLVAQMAVFAALPAAAQNANITYTFTNVIRAQSNNISIASVVADSAGDVFFADNGDGNITKATPNPGGTYTQTAIPTSATRAISVAIDSSGNLYVADGAQKVYKETLSGGSYTESTVASSFTTAKSVYVDAAGDVYVLDAGTNSVYLEKLSGGTYTTNIVVGGLQVSGLDSIAADSAGNVYIAESANSRILKETLGSGTYTQSIVEDSTTFTDNSFTVSPTGVAVDYTGAVLFVNQNYGVFKAVPNGATYTVTKVAGDAGVGVSLDSHGNLYVAGVSQVYVAPVNELAESSSGQNFGSLNVGTSAAAQTATFTFDAGGTLATIPYAVSTQGDLTLDFQAALTQAANVCVTGHTYNAGESCTVAATFTPTRPGARYGAIALFAPSGTPIATSYLQGTGMSPQVSFSPGLLSDAIGSTFGGAVTVDSSNNVIFADLDLRSITVAHPLAIVSTSFTTGYTGSNGYSGTNQGGGFGDGFTVDGAGNIIYSDGFLGLPGQYPTFVSTPGATSFSAYDLNPNLPITPISSLQESANVYGKAFLTSIPLAYPTVPPGNNRPAIDGAGNLYFSDDTGNQILEQQYVHGAYNNQLVVATGLNNPGDVVVDGAGAVYVMDTGNKRIVKETPTGSGTYTQTIVDSSFTAALQGLGIDRVGNLYVTILLSGSNSPVVIKETLVNGSYTQSSLTIGGDSGVDVNAAGDVFAVESGFGGYNFIDELDVSTAPSFIFGATAVGSTSSDSPKTVTITNNGNAPLTFSGNLAITTGFTLSPTSTCSQGGSSAPLAAGASCTLLINFVPTQSGFQNGTLTVTDNHLNASAATQVIKLNGQGTGIGTVAATLSPSTYNYRSVTVGSPASQSFTLANSGSSSINIASAGLASGPFALGSTNCGTTLAAGSTCAYTVVFTPTAVGVQSTPFSVTDDAGTQTAMISGTGVQTAAPQAGLTPGTANFGSFSVNTTSAASNFTVTNTGNAALSITSFGISGVNSSSFQQGASTCGSSLAAGASCTIAVTFAPTSVGTFTATLSVTDFVGTQSAALSGTATALTVAQAALTPPTANFGSSVSGSTSAAQTFTLANAGGVALPVTSVVISGTNASSFEVGTNTCGSSLNAGSSCIIAVTFTPASAGSFTATLSVADAVGTQTSTLSGAGTSAPTTGADFTISATPATQSSYRGTAVSYPLQLASVSSTNLFTSAVVLSVTGLPAGASATFSPVSVTPGTGVTSSLTITIPSLNASRSFEGRPLTFGGISAAALLLILLPRRRRLPFRLLLVLCALGALSAGAIGCGSGNGFAIPSSASTLIITGTSGAITHTTSVSLTVQ